MRRQQRRARKGNERRSRCNSYRPVCKNEGSMIAKDRPAPWLETRRLEFTMFVDGDFDELYRLDSDPRVMKYIADGKPASREAVVQRLQRFLRYPALYPDLGVWRASPRD